MDHEDIERIIESKIATALESILETWGRLPGEDPTQALADLERAITTEIDALRS